MKTYYRLVWMLTALFFIYFPMLAQENWREKTNYLIYSPRYFGPNAFPVPEIRNGIVSKRYEVELRGEYHHYTGDITKDIYSRIYLPFAKGRVAIEVSFMIKEWFRMTQETADDRFAHAPTYPHAKYNGDVVVNALFQLWKSDKWFDIMAGINLKTASGGANAFARHTDAANYWFDINIGRNIWHDPVSGITLRLQAGGGFYCWMTNSIVHRQDDAASFGVGLSATFRQFSFQSDFAGFRGYENNGDRPLILRNNLRYEYKKNILSLRYNHGMRDNLYDTWSLGYIRAF